MNTFEQNVQIRTVETKQSLAENKFGVKLGQNFFN